MHGHLAPHARSTVASEPEALGVEESRGRVLLAGGQTSPPANGFGTREGLFRTREGFFGTREQGGAAGYRRSSASSTSSRRSSRSSMPTERRTMFSGTSSTVPRTEACVMSEG